MIAGNELSEFAHLAGAFREHLLQAGFHEEDARQAALRWLLTTIERENA